MFLFGLPFSSENATVTYHLQFGVPLADDGFMKYMMSGELVWGILLQDLHDKNISGCEALGLDPASLLLYGKLSKSRGQRCDGKHVNQIGADDFGLIFVQVIFHPLWRLHSPCLPGADRVVGKK